MRLLAHARSLIAAVVLVLAATGAAVAAEGRPLKVVASFTILGDMVRQIAGDSVSLTTLVGPDGDTHVFQPSPRDAKAVAEADLLVVNGLGFESWLDRLTQAASYKGGVVVASQGVKTRRMVEDGKTEIDPHAWQDLANGRHYVETITAALAKADPAHAESFRANGGRYADELARLDAWVRAQIAEVPAAKRQVITSHDAFGYFGAAYGIAFLAPQGINSESEVTAKELGALIRQVRKTGIKAVFMENMSDPRLVEQLAKEAGASVGGKLYVDALSAADGPAPTYAGMFTNNVPQLRAGMLRN